MRIEFFKHDYHIVYKTLYAYYQSKGTTPFLVSTFYLFLRILFVMNHIDKAIENLSTLEIVYNRFLKTFSFRIGCANLMYSFNEINLN